MSDDLDPVQRRAKFFRAAAHDLRNPIAALIGYAALIETGRELDDEQKHFLARLQETTLKLHDAASRLLEVAWLNAEMPLADAALAFDAVVSSAIDAVTPFAQEKSIAIDFTPPAEPITLVADAERLHASVYELLRNAVLYSGEGKRVTASVLTENRAALCIITDEGIGIPENERETVFDRLYRSRDPRVQALPGGGMGLTLARKIAQHYGGTIILDSEIDRGSTFTLRLPLA